MSTGRTWQTESFSSDDTFAIGEQLGKSCKGGEVFVLTSDLGGGKTTLTKGLAKGLGCNETVSSPTFTVSRDYTCDRGLMLRHFDFYRLSEPGVVLYELSEVISEPSSVIVIEWGDIVEEVLPEHRVILTLSRTQTSESHRSIKIEFPERMRYLLGAAS